MPKPDKTTAVVGAKNPKLTAHLAEKPPKDKKKKKNKLGKLGKVNSTSLPIPVTVQDRIAQDPQFMRTTARVKSVFESVQLEKMVDRLVDLHETRHIRKLSVKEILSDQQTKLIEAELQNGAHRTTAVSIRVKMVRASYTIHDAVRKLRKYIFAVYKDDLKEAASTIADRNAIVDMIFAEYDQYNSELEMALAVSEDVIKDQDSAGYSLLRITKVLELTVRDKG